MENTQRKVSNAELVSLTVHVDVLAQFDQLHFSRHVTHGPHQVAQVFAGDEAVLVFVELNEGLTQLWRAQTQNTNEISVRETELVEEGNRFGWERKEKERELAFNFIMCESSHLKQIHHDIISH